MRNLDLTGEWLVYKAGSKRGYPAYAPGCIHGTLLDSGVIEDPFAGRNLETADEILRSGWRYEKIFVAEDLSSYKSVLLHFDGVTAPAGITLNGRRAASVSTPFLALDVDVKHLVKPGKNVLSVDFAAIKKSDTLCRNPPAEPALTKKKSCGLWGDIYLRARSRVSISDVFVATELKNSNTAELNVSFETQHFTSGEKLELLARLCYKGNILNELRIPCVKGKNRIKLTVKNPQLWWPATMGEQPLYEMTLDVLDGRICLEHATRRIGLRKFEMREECIDERRVKRFYINGKPLLLKGAEWVPADLYVARLTRVEYAHLIKSAVIANINLLRVSECGIYENDCFYNLCDEYGVCVWQEVTASGKKAGQPEKEMKSTLHRLAHHPSLVVWYNVEENTLLSSGPASMTGLSSSHTVWIDKKPAEVELINYGDKTPVISGAPGPREIARYLNQSQRNISHPVSRFHLSSKEDIRNMYNGFVDNFRMPSSFDSTLWLSQIQHALYIKWTVENLRMDNIGRAGYIFRRLNDGWPCCSPSSLDYFGAWKALHYMTRRYYAPLSVCGQYDAEKKQAVFFAFNDNIKSFKGELSWSVSLMDGSIVLEGSRKISLSAVSRGRPVKVRVSDLIRKHEPSEIIMWMYLADQQGNRVSWNVLLFCKPFELSLQQPRMRAEIRKHDETSYVVTLTSRTPAMWAWVSLEGMDAVYSDNFFCMESAKPFNVKIIPRQRIKLDEFRQRFRIGSLRDTWLEKGALMQMRSSQKKK
ncbi:MAG: glycoside hydrolase family 2 protein [Kiritimatiellia bacterium]